MKKFYPILLSILFISLSLQTLAYPPPEKDEMTINELAACLFDLDGKVIETEVTGASSFDQVAKGKYRVYCRYYKGSGSYNGEYVSFDEDGKEFFEELTKKDYWSSSTETVYLLVENGKLEAIGTRYKKSKGTYSW